MYYLNTNKTFIALIFSFCMMSNNWIVEQIITVIILLISLTILLTLQNYNFYYIMQEIIAIVANYFCKHVEDPMHRRF